MVGTVPLNWYPNNGKGNVYTGLYENSTVSFVNSIWVYTVWSVFSILINISAIFFKGNKGVLAPLKKLFLFDPIVRFGIFISILVKRTRFANKVCFCDFKEQVSIYEQ